MGLLVMTLVSGLSTARVAGAQRESRAVDRLLSRADAAAARGRGASARRLRLRALDRSDPEDGRAALALAAALPTAPAAPLSSGEADRAHAARVAEALDAFVSTLPRSAARGETGREADRARAWARALAGNLDAAIEQAAGAAGLQDRQSAALLRRLATTAALTDRLHAARRALEAAHRAWPQDNDILSELGAVTLALGAPQLAVEHYQRILGRRPDDLETRRDLAGALVAAGQADAAAALLADALARHDDVDLRLELAHAALEAGDAALAERASRDAIERLPEDDGRGHSVLGAALAARQRRGEARVAFREALRRDDDDLRARQGLAALDRPTDAPAASAAQQLAAP